MTNMSPKKVDKMKRYKNNEDKDTNTFLALHQFIERINRNEGFRDEVIYRTFLSKFGLEIFLWELLEYCLL